MDCLAEPGALPSPLSRQQIKAAMTKGAVWLAANRGARRLRRAKTVLRPGAVLHIYYDARVLAAEPAAPQLIADEGDYSVWYKPFGVLAQGSKWGDHCAITRCAEKTLEPERPAFVVHRLDRAATGLTLIAHRKQAAAKLSALFHERRIDKRYRVVAHGRWSPAEGETRIDADVDGRAALSFVSLLAYDPAQDRSLLDVRIETGRKHQIRAHLSGTGHPVVGDRQYGPGGDSEDLQLTACRPALHLPVQRRGARLPPARATHGGAGAGAKLAARLPFRTGDLMKLYTSLGPNPHVVRMFIAEKHIELPTQQIDVRGGETRREPYMTEVNRRGQSPALELDNGDVLCEITVICEYLDELYPDPPLIGTTAEERGETRMWTRRIDLAICEPMANGFRYSEGYELFKDRFRLIPEAADGLKALARDNLAWLDAEMAGKTFVCGDRFTLADVLLYCFIKFGGDRNQPLDPANQNLTAWFARIGERPSASA